MAPHDARTAQFVERFALLLEDDGLPRVSARLFGLLLVSVEPLSLDDLAEKLGVTKASISVNVRMLEEKGVVERVGKPGDRRDYYRIVDDIVERSMQHRVARIRRFQTALETAVREMPGRRDIIGERLRGMGDGFLLLIDSTNRALHEWRHRGKRRTPRSGKLRSIVTHACLALALASAKRLQAQADTTRLSLGDAARLAEYRAEAAKGRALVARSALLPQLFAHVADGSRTFNTASFGLSLPGFDPNGEVVGPVRTVDVRGRVAVPVLDPSGYQRYRAALAVAAFARADAAAVAQVAASAATSLYDRTLRAEAQLDARAADSVLAAELLGIAQRQLETGVGVALDVTRARAQLSTVRAQLISARNERDRSQLDLKRVLGLDATSPIVLRDSLAATDVSAPLPGATAAVALARQHRADLRAAESAVQSARLAVSATRAERLPTIGVFGDDGATSKSWTHLLNTYTYGVQISIPVFEGMRTSARVQEQTASLHEAETRRHDVELQVTVDVQAALLDLDAGRQQLSAVRERLALGEQELAQARERFRAGVSGNADVIIAQLNLDAARSLYVDALAALESARVGMARAQGLLLELP
jgi:outer membrane protein